MNAEARAGVEGDLAKRVAALCHRDGEFVLRSGQVATTYFDKYLFEAEPELLGRVASKMAALVPAGTEVRRSCLTMLDPAAWDDVVGAVA